MKFLLDTNVVSAARKRTPAPTAWLNRQNPELVHISVLTLGEILSGARKKARRDPVAGLALEKWAYAVRQQYEARVLDVTEAVALEWGRIAAIRTRGEIDGLLAATAIIHGLTIATRNVADTGVAIVNPWDE